MSKNSGQISRRTTLEMLLAAGGAIAGSGMAWSGVLRKEAVVETSSGNVQGRLADQVWSFLGIPYGDTTAGKNRFLPPRKPIPWHGTRKALTLGPRSPQPTIAKFLQEFVASLPKEQQAATLKRTKENLELMGRYEETTPHNGEDCLVLNVWSPALDNSKRPVMVWLHGDGFCYGSGGGSWFNGSHLAGRNDVVVVTVNHRLNLLGYLHLGAWGNEKYAKSGNVGMLDIVGALEWVRDNIQAFGGDPGNVTFFGQSGGSEKIATLMAMPAARGLFHKAIRQSAPMIEIAVPEEAARTAEFVLSRLSIQKNQIDRIQDVDVKDLYAAMPKGFITVGRFAPVTDGVVLSEFPFREEAPAGSKGVLLMMGLTRNDFSDTFNSIPVTDAVSLRAKVGQMLHIDGEQLEDLIQVYSKGAHQLNFHSIYQDISTDHFARIPIIREAELKVRQGDPTFMYRFDWRIPAKGGIYGSPHVVEVPFVFDNMEMAESFEIPESERESAQALADNVSRAWTSFARSGNPSHAGIPNWSQFTIENRATMVFNTTCRVVNDPDGDRRRAMAALPPPEEFHLSLK